MMCTRGARLAASPRCRSGQTAYNAFVSDCWPTWRAGAEDCAAEVQSATPKSTDAGSAREACGRRRLGGARR
eukprot:13444786-Alexandrium_andersonii.AAC.1